MYKNQSPAEIFDDIKKTTGLPVPEYIQRHLNRGLDASEVHELGEFIKAVYITGKIEGMHPKESGENTGLPCPNCGVKQKKIDMQRDGEDFLLRLSGKFNAKELKDWVRLVKGWVT